MPGFTMEIDYGRFAVELHGTDIKIWDGSGLPVYEGGLDGANELYPALFARLLADGYIRQIP